MGGNYGVVDGVVDVGAGAVGASAAFHLAKPGGARVRVADRGPVRAGGTAKSRAIVPSHDSIASNTRLTLANPEIFRDFQEPLDPYRPSRFAAGALLKGAYGIGSIS